MTKNEDFKLLKIQTCVLKVNIHCDGCKQKVKKLLQRTEGVYQVNIDADQQKVTVSGSIDSATLIKKLGKAGKHAEIWSQQSKNQVQKQTNNICLKGGKNNDSINKGLEVFKNGQKFPSFTSEDDDDDDENEEDEENELRFLRPTQSGLLRQQMNNAAKNIGPIAANINKMSNIGQNKGNPMQNLGLKISPSGGIANLKMNTAQLGDQMNLGGFRGGNCATNAAVVEGNAYPNPNCYQQAQAGSLMMMQNQQPQLMYQRSPFIAPNSAYYYNSSHAPALAPCLYTDQMPNFSGDSSALVFSDEDDSSCSIM